MRRHCGRLPRSAWASGRAWRRACFPACSRAVAFFLGNRASRHCPEAGLSSSLLERSACTPSPRSARAGRWPGCPGAWALQSLWESGSSNVGLGSAGRSSPGARSSCSRGLLWGLLGGKFPTAGTARAAGRQRVTSPGPRAGQVREHMAPVGTPPPQPNLWAVSSPKEGDAESSHPHDLSAATLGLTGLDGSCPDKQVPAS